MHPELVDRLVVIGVPHPVAWGDNMSLSQVHAPSVWCMAALHTYTIEIQHDVQAQYSSLIGFRVL
jgi:hypothetical protein